MQNSMESTIEALDQWFIFLNSPNYQQSGWNPELLLRQEYPLGPGAVPHACNSSCARGIGRRIVAQSQHQVKTDFLKKQLKQKRFWIKKQTNKQQQNWQEKKSPLDVYYFSKVLF
jgi:hypothetical protein